jgi:hypothetical protein
MPTYHRSTEKRLHKRSIAARKTRRSHRDRQKMRRQLRKQDSQGHMHTLKLPKGTKMFLSL